MQVLRPNRLPVIFDLDETLLVARSMSQLEKEAKRIEAARCAWGGVG